ncbi:MAG TPA: glyceraldehyde 3-phosphate dehydrogenase NAD-binding domain-containing protein [Candidatus Saccharimonadales bacterium]|jgi:glyceraldehyde 3-phosphate dehydrogenase
MIRVAINGFGRFGMHLLQYWVDNYKGAQFDIVAINDDALSIEKIKTIIKNDPYLTLKNSIDFKENALIIKIGNTHKNISYSTVQLGSVSWVGEVDLLLECSGKHTEKSDWSEVLISKTRYVVISATSWTADQILVYGYNHQNFSQDVRKVISYGSCTVNAYIPLAKWVHDRWGVIDSDVGVIHNIPLHKNGKFNTLERRACTLEQVAPHLLDFLHEDNFTVIYTLVPYTGVSMIDYRFRVTKETSKNEFIDSLSDALASGDLMDLYGLAEYDNGPEEHKFTKKSAVLVKPNIKVVGDNIYIGGYFDNENSVNRFFDIANYIAKAEK